MKYILIFHKDKEKNKIMLNVIQASQYFYKPQFHIQHLRKKKEKKNTLYIYTLKRTV